MTAYKLVKVRKNGTLGSLFINARAILPIGEWLRAEFYPTKGYQPRMGWHCTFTPYAPHLSIKQRVWVEVEVSSYRTYERPECQGGAWILADSMKINRIISMQEAERQLLARRKQDGPVWALDCAMEKSRAQTEAQRGHSCASRC